MKDAQAKTIFLKDYQEPGFVIERVSLTFRLFEEGAEVRSLLKIKKAETKQVADLKLDGEELELRSLKLEGEELAAERYVQTEESLLIKNVPDSFELECLTWIKPQENKRLEGLYKSSSMFCTQCEAEGFRRITYYLDRPDVMSVFETRIEADKTKYPALLSNGNPIESGDLADGRHFVTWEDPFRKPCYLFALVAGDLHCHEGEFTTCSGRKVDLKIFVEHKNSDKCDYALDCLQRSMKWDEEIYGREYDLDIFMIVAVDDFNMGAMENKGLNIFNSSCVLAKPETATDNTYLRIEAIVAHEYFHNWSGNRVTCRDWFQLSLKEGFTVFRDSQFSADMNSAEVKRIEDVNLLRTAQFAEDAGPMSHPVRPASYMEIGNFYTLTVYEKGAEVVRMYHTLLGAEKFREGSDLYFERHDGQAVTTDDFAAAMEQVSGRDLTQFKRWYDQSGTPEVKVSSHYDASQKQYTLRFEQSCPPTPGQKEKLPFLIPITLGLLNAQGSELPLSPAKGKTTWVYELAEAQAELVFENVEEEPIPSLLRGFSAPVKLHYEYTDSQLLFLMANDTDGFNRWDAGQRLSVNVLQALIADYQAGNALELAPEFIEAWRSILSNKQLDKSMVCQLLILPSESYLIELSEQADVEAIHHVREFVRQQLAASLSDLLREVYQDNVEADSGTQVDYVAMSKRALKNAALSLLSCSADDQFIEMATTQFANADNMTDSHSALASLINAGAKTEAQSALEEFHKRWKDDAQVMELWLSLQSGNANFAKLEDVERLMSLPDFDLTNPNKVRSVIGVFCNANLANFHDASGTGYQFLADQIIKLDDLNPQIASRLTTPLTRWKKHGEQRQALMIEQLKRIHGKNKLSKDVREVVEKSLP